MAPLALWVPAARRQARLRCWSAAPSRRPLRCPQAVLQRLGRNWGVR
ncbi:MAG: hypothetical protein GY877_07495 [Hyphomicrobium sp.]|nr:hypothetical protein [Hyphomicrobium sp.]